MKRKVVIVELVYSVHYKINAQPKASFTKFIFPMKVEITENATLMRSSYFQTSNYEHKSTSNNKNIRIKNNANDPVLGAQRKWALANNRVESNATGQYM